KQAFHLDQDHRWKVFAHVFAITLAYFSRSFAVFNLVCHVDHESRDTRRLSAGSIHDRHHVLQRFVELIYEVLTDDLLVCIPGDLARDEKQSAACISEQAVCVTTRRAERFWIN